MDIFEILNNITQKKPQLDFDNEEVEKAYNPYLINRWISMCFAYLPIVELMNQTKNLPKKIHYQFLYNIIPKSSVRFNYIKKKKNDSLEDEKRKLLMRHFEFSVNDLECLLSVMSEDYIQGILDMYKSGKVR